MELKFDVKKPSPICYLEIPAPNVEAACGFYKAIFGWSIKESSLTNEKYCIFSTGEGLISGGFDSSAVVRDGGVLIYLKVQDIKSTLTDIANKGGKVLIEKTAVGGDSGFFAKFEDPNGNHIGIWSEH